MYIIAIPKTLRIVMLTCCSCRGKLCIGFHNMCAMPLALTLEQDLMVFVFLDMRGSLDKLGLVTAGNVNTNTAKTQRPASQTREMCKQLFGHVGTLRTNLPNQLGSYFYWYGNLGWLPSALRFPSSVVLAEHSCTCSTQMCIY
jgi:hypothetical protein